MGADSLIQYLSVLGVNTPFNFAVFVRGRAAPLVTQNAVEILIPPGGDFSKNRVEINMSISLIID